MTMSHVGFRRPRPMRPTAWARIARAHSWVRGATNQCNRSKAAGRAVRRWRDSMQRFVRRCLHSVDRLRARDALQSGRSRSARSSQPSSETMSRAQAPTNALQRSARLIVNLAIFMRFQRSSRQRWEHTRRSTWFFRACHRKKLVARPDPMAWHLAVGLTLGWQTSHISSSRVSSKAACRKVLWSTRSCPKGFARRSD